MSVLCYNRSCGKRFDPDNNPDDACLFHPGVPVFHDALKGWSCCKRRTTDFSDFLSIKGCSRGPHNSEKPAEAVQPEVKMSGKKKEIREELEETLTSFKLLNHRSRSTDQEMRHRWSDYSKRCPLH